MYKYELQLHTPTCDGSLYKDKQCQSWSIRTNFPDIPGLVNQNQVNETVYFNNELHDKNIKKAWLTGCVLRRGKLHL
jgi:hypothetical protein